MPHARSAVVLAAVLALAGCDRFADVPAPPTPDAPLTPTQPEVQMYVKGQPDLLVGQAYEFRAQPVPEVDHYTWSVSGTGRATVAMDEGTRIVTVTGTRPGEAVVHARALDARNRILSVGTRPITVR